MQRQRSFKLAECAVGLLVAVLFLSPCPASAENTENDRRIRLTLGPQLVPSFPGSAKVSLSPYVGVSMANGDEPFSFSAPDDGASIALYKHDGLSVGPIASLTGKRRSRDAGGLSRVSTTVNLGGFVRYEFERNFRVSAVVQQGINGHRALSAMLGADYFARDGDRWLWSIGPRLTLATNRYARVYFGVTPNEASATGIPAYFPRGAFTAAGIAAGARRQLNSRFGLAAYAKYDRLLGDAAHSPVVSRFGSRNQWSGGIALSYTFAMKR